jgi:hypothetical protein
LIHPPVTEMGVWSLGVVIVGRIELWGITAGTG